MSRNSPLLDSAEIKGWEGNELNNIAKWHFVLCYDMDEIIEKSAGHPTQDYLTASVSGEILVWGLYRLALPSYQ